MRKNGVPQKEETADPAPTHRRRGSSRSRVRELAEAYDKASDSANPAADNTAYGVKSRKNPQKVATTPKWLQQFYARRSLLIFWGMLHILDVVNDTILAVQMFREGQTGLAVCAALILVTARLVTTRLVMGPCSGWISDWDAARRTALIALDVYPFVELGRLLRSPETPHEAQIALDPCFMSPTVIFVEVVLESIPQLFLQMVSATNRLMSWNHHVFRMESIANVAAETMISDDGSATAVVTGVSMTLSLVFSALLLAITLSASEQSDTKGKQVISQPITAQSFLAPSTLQMIKTLFRFLEILGRALTLSLLVSSIYLVTSTPTHVAPDIAKRGVHSILYSKVDTFLRETLGNSSGCDATSVVAKSICTMVTSQVLCSLSVLIVVILINLVFIYALSELTLAPINRMVDRSTNSAKSLIVSIRPWIACILTFVFWERPFIAHIPIAASASVSACEEQHLTAKKLKQLPQTPKTKTIILSPISARTYYVYRAVETTLLIVLTYLFMRMAFAVPANPTSMYAEANEVTRTTKLGFMASFVDTQLVGLSTAKCVFSALPELITVSLMSRAAQIRQHTVQTPQLASLQKFGCFQSVESSHQEMLSFLVAMDSILCLIVSCTALLAADAFGWRKMSIGQGDSAHYGPVERPTCSPNQPILMDPVHQVQNDPEVSAVLEHWHSTPRSQRKRIMDTLERLGIPVSSTPRRAYIYVIDELKQAQKEADGRGTKGAVTPTSRRTATPQNQANKTPNIQQAPTTAPPVGETTRRSRRTTSFFTGSQIALDMDIAGTNSASHFKTRF